MSKYEDWLNASFKNLIKDYCNGDFEPQNESDVKCHLYHTLLQTKSQISSLNKNHLVLSEFPFSNSNEKIDLALVRTKRGKERPIRPRLLIEVKKTDRDEEFIKPRYVEKDEKIGGDIRKLRRYMEAEDEEYLKYCRKPAIVFFFTSASRRGIGTRTDRMMKELDSKYGDITLLWGPR